MKLKDYLDEDLGAGDMTSDALIRDEKASAVIIAKESCILAGLEEAIKLFGSLNLKTHSNLTDGTQVEKGQEILRIQGRVKEILKVERTALNFIMRMSGIATETHNLVEKCRKIKANVRIAATRKTTPGFRAYEKKAVVIGGGDSHRNTLFDAILIKDNHLKVVGSVKEALRRTKKSPVKVEIEVTNVEDAVIAAKEGPDIIMLDNMKPIDVKEAYEKIKQINNKIEVEVSGNITSRNIMHYILYADIISIGALTHSVKSKNFSLEIVAISR